MSREDLSFKLRVPEPIMEALKKAAEESRRSLTAEMAARLEASLGGEGGSLPASLMARVKARAAREKVTPARWLADTLSEELERLDVLDEMNERANRENALDLAGLSESQFAELMKAVQKIKGKAK